MANQDSDPFFHRMDELENLVKRQQRALEMATDLLKLKDELLDLTEQQVDLYKQQNKRLTRSLWICSAWMILMLIISLIRLLA